MRDERGEEEAKAGRPGAEETTLTGTQMAGLSISTADSNRAYCHLGTPTSTLPDIDHESRRFEISNSSLSKLLREFKPQSRNRSTNNIK